MSDVLDSKQRAFCMSRIRQRNTTPEVKLRKLLWNKGIRYRINTQLIGKPDIVFIGKRTVVFVDGCFWHGCPEHYVEPKARREFWQKKILKNRARDLLVNEALKLKGWEVLRFWEHEIKTAPHDCVEKIIKVLSRIDAKEGA